MRGSNAGTGTTIVIGAYIQHRFMVAELADDPWRPHTLRPHTLRGSPRGFDRFDQIKSPARKRGQVMEELSREGHWRAYHIAGWRWLRKCHTSIPEFELGISCVCLGRHLTQRRDWWPAGKRRQDEAVGPGTRPWR